MTSTNACLPLKLRAGFKVKDIQTGYRLPVQYYQNSSKLPKTCRELQNFSLSNEKENIEPRSSIPHKLQTKTVLPAIKVNKTTLFKRQKEREDSLTLDKILGGAFKAIDLNQMEDFSEQLFPPRPTDDYHSGVQENLSGYRIQRHYVDDKNKINEARSLSYEVTFREMSALSSEKKSILKKPVLKLEKSLLGQKLNRRPSKEESSEDEMSSDSPTFPSYHQKSNAESYGSYSPPALETNYTPSIFRLENINMVKNKEFNRLKSPIEEKRQRRHTPAVLIMDDRKDFLRINDCSQELNRGVDEFGLQETQHSAKFGGSVSPNDFRIERLDVKRNSKEIKSHLEKSMVEQRIMLEESVLMQKHNVTFRTKPKQESAEFLKKEKLQLPSITKAVSGRSLRNSTPFSGLVKEQNHSAFRVYND